MSNKKISAFFLGDRRTKKGWFAVYNGRTLKTVSGEARRFGNEDTALAAALAAAEADAALPADEAAARATAAAEAARVALADAWAAYQHAEAVYNEAIKLACPIHQTAAACTEDSVEVQS